MSVQSTFYNAFFKRSSTFALFMVTTAFFFERTIDVTADFIFERLNEGKLWHHIKPKEE